MKTLTPLAALVLGTALTQHAIACDSSHQANATPMGTTPVQGECEAGFCGTPTQNCAPGYCGPTLTTSRRHKSVRHPSAYHQWPRHHTGTG
jgi:hypothetical protein